MALDVDVDVQTDTRAIVFSAPLLLGEGPGAVLRQVAGWLDERPRLTAYSLTLDETADDRWIAVLTVSGWVDECLTGGPHRWVGPNLLQCAECGVDYFVARGRS